MEKLSFTTTQSPSSSTTKIHSIPLDIWIKITSTFSTKSLIILSFVNKFFLSIITDPVFISAHLRRPSSGDQYLTCVRESHGVVFAITEIEFEESRKFCMGLRFRDLVIKPGLKEIEPNKVQWDVACSLDGLVVLAKKMSKNATLWNPSIRKHRLLELPKPEIEKCFGIGCRSDSLCNDYKLVALHASQDEAWIYTIRSNSWTPITNRRFDDHDKNIHTYSASISIKHTIAWIESVYDIESPPFRRLRLFDLETETFHHTYLPCSANRNRSLTLLDGGSTVGTWWADVKGEINVWALDIETVDWAVRYKLGPLTRNFYFIGRGMFAEEDGELVLRYWEENQRVNFVTFSFDVEREIYSMESVGTVGGCLDVYHESLVMIN